MTKILINGINGKMGKEVAKLVLENSNMYLLGGLDCKVNHNLPYKVFTDTNSIFEKPDIIIDFSVPDATISLLPYCIQNNIGIVIATTGFTDKQQEQIAQTALQIPVFQSANMSYQISLVNNVIAELSQKLPNAEIEIVETHHDQKKDSPSGTAIMLANSINKANNNCYSYDFNRMQKTEKRNPKEIGFSSIRGGNIVGEHSILFFSPNETLEIKHSAYSRTVFAEGAIKAAEFLGKQKILGNTGLFGMCDLIQQG